MKIINVFVCTQLLCVSKLLRLSFCIVLFSISSFANSSESVDSVESIAPAALMPIIDLILNSPEEEVEDVTSLYNITLFHDFGMQRDGSLGDNVAWHIERDGQRVLQRNASNEIRYRYFANTIGSDIRAWLERFDDGTFQRVSNIVEYTPGVTNLFRLDLGANFELMRSGNLGDSLAWVIERDGEIVLQRNASNELDYTYFANNPGSKFRVWLTQFIDNERQIVSNTVEYEVGQSDFNLTVDQQFNVYRNGQLGDQVRWVIERDGGVVLRRNAESELSYQYFNNAFGSSFRVFLEMFVDGSYQTVSNTVEYSVPESYPFSLSIDSTFEITRSGNLGDSVTINFVEDGYVVFDTIMSNELSYRYFRNFSGRTYSVYLERSIGGSRQQVSNTITYTVP